MSRWHLLAGAAILCTGCVLPPAEQAASSPATSAPQPAAEPPAQGPAETAEPDTNTNPDQPFTMTKVATFQRPWAMAFIPNTPWQIISELTGQLKLRHVDSGAVHTLQGVPTAHVAGQGGLGDIIVDPRYDGTGPVPIFLSWASAGPMGVDLVTSGAVVGRTTIDLDKKALAPIDVLWTQAPKVEGSGHYSMRLALSPKSGQLYITSGDRQKMTPAQDPSSDLGKIIRVDLETKHAQHWSRGHRNPLGLQFDRSGNLWASEMGPKGGDEINLIRKGQNYGWPLVSEGDHYDGKKIPNHTPGDGFVAPRFSWNPSISPGGLCSYHGTLFPEWTGNLFAPALSGRGLIRLEKNGTQLNQTDYWPLEQRIRAVTEGPDGALWLLTDGDSGALYVLRPAN